MAKDLSPHAQLDRLKASLRGHQFDRNSSHLPFVVDVIANWPAALPDYEQESLVGLVASCFQIPSAEVRDLIKADEKPKVVNKLFDDLVPKSGWLADYIHATIHAEPPTVFHFFCAASALGAMTDRRIWVSKGHYRVYPNLNILLIAPTGKCRKTTAINIMQDILLQAGYEKFVIGVSTPEAFILEIGVNDPASCYIIGREMAAFFRKAKYLEGMIPIFTDLTDCPDHWRSLTIGRGKMVLKNVMLSSAFASTMDWVNTNLPADVFGGGFMRRYLTIYQERTTRLSPIPPDIGQAKTDLSLKLKLLAEGNHEFVLEGEPRAWYIDWYTKLKSKPIGEHDERMEGYLESKPDHILRLAMLLAISQGVRELRVELLEHSLALLDWTEQFLPKAFTSMASSPIGELEDKIIRALRNSGGRMSHSDLCRRMSKHITASRLADIINTLKESDLLTEKAKSHEEPRSYYLTKRSRGSE